MSLVPSRANIVSASIIEWAVHDSSRPDVGYSAIPFIRQGSLELTTLSTPDWAKRPVPFAQLLKLMAQFPAVKTKANFISLLTSLSTNTIDHRVKTLDVICSSKPTTNPLSPTGFGIGWKLIADGDMDKDMYVELTSIRKLSPDEFTNAFTSIYADSTAADAADTFYDFSLLTRADIIPAAISEIELGVADAGTYLDVISNLRKGKFTAELKTTDNSHGMNTTAGMVDLSFDIESMEIREAELLKWKPILQRLNECKIKFAGGLTFACPHQLGITTDTVVKGDMSDIGYLKVTGGGAITLSAFAGLWS